MQIKETMSLSWEEKCANSKTKRIYLAAESIGNKLEAVITDGGKLTAQKTLEIIGKKHGQIKLNILHSYWEQSSQLPCTSIAKMKRKAEEEARKSFRGNRRSECPKVHLALAR
ncbi:hypothetical protein KC926_03130 [Candidatus Kaiserbacteria bacterium]|nr:hypothetical protein [Candidatus Kaiserbacteria bacterium]